MTNVEMNVRDRSLKRSHKEEEEEEVGSKIIISFRSNKVEIPLYAGLMGREVKERVLMETNHHESSMNIIDMKLLFKGKPIDDHDNLLSIIIQNKKKKKNNNNNSKKIPKVVRMVATGRSSLEVEAWNKSLEASQKSAPRLRDDLTKAGQRELEERKRLGRSVLRRAAAKDGGGPLATRRSRFGRIETLPGLPDEHKAREILTSLANDPGIRACMEKHNWTVGSLAELYPKGKVGESPVCVMGLNKNKGEQILLRIRTDDLKGFRKVLSIRKVLFHELAHNVYSEHDGNFFRLMRTIEKESNAMDWTGGSGISSFGHDETYEQVYSGGVYRLGGRCSDSNRTHKATLSEQRERAAQAAMSRMSAEEVEIHQNCGCGREDLFLPESLKRNRAVTFDNDGESTQSSMDTN